MPHVEFYATTIDTREGENLNAHLKRMSGHGWELVTVTSHTYTGPPETEPVTGREWQRRHQLHTLFWRMDRLRPETLPPPS
ncbi:MAG TPA: hypothetical protein VNT51_03825 [Miltoncostaeaceae bacterium]|jgi:hypothetical protein|nr:hypothetical protein [Miltoncostaeaceae bacterium]